VETASWYVLRTEPSAEYQAAKELTREGFDIFFPTMKSPQNRMGHTNAPMFPGYLFLRHDPEAAEWPSFRPAHRVTGWVRFGGEIPSVPDDVITQLTQRLAGIDPSTGLWRRFRHGEAVKVNSGQFQSIGEVVEEAKRPEARSLVLLEFMGQMVKAKIPWSDLEPISHNLVELNKAPRRTRGRGRWVRGFGPANLSQAKA